MTRWTRSLNSVTSSQIFPLLRRHHLAVAAIAPINLKRISPPQPIRKLVSAAVCRGSDAASTMESPPPPPPPLSDSEIIAVSAGGDAVAEDFVHVENSDSDPAPDPNPNPNPENSQEGIVGAHQLENDTGLGDSGSGEVGGDGEGVVPPEELMKNVMVLSCESTAEGGSCDVYLVGTAHVSQESCREVQAVIRSLKPQVVFLELCSSRVAVLTPQNLKVPTMGEMVDMWKKNHNLFGILYSWFLAKVASKLEVFPGSEFRVAFEEAMKYGGRVILGDRPVQVTLRRTWGSMPLWHKTKLIYSLFFQAVFLPSPEDLNKMLKEMDDVDALTLVIQEMSKQFPTLMETLVHERDQYMSSTLLRVASLESSVVAVVGKGHLQGIKKHWKQPIEVKDLLELPSRQQTISMTKILTSVSVAVAGVAIISGIYLASKK